jgi:DNA polymerase III epsilon subunit-like protein
MPTSVTPIECLISVDVESAGPSPSRYALLSVGACLVDEPGRRFYVELKPDRQALDPQAAAIHGLSMSRLRREGMAPAEAMAAFEGWIQSSLSGGQVPIFAGFNAAFDWMFIADYFHRYLGRNPFGHAPLDIKAFYMGLAGVPFLATSRRHLAESHPEIPPVEHQALQDAIDQAELLRRMLAAQARLPSVQLQDSSRPEGWQPDGSYPLHAGDPHE